MDNRVARVTNAAERRRLQNRIAQRNHRSRCKINSTQANKDSSNTLIWTQPRTIPRPLTRARKHEQQQQQQQQQQQEQQATSNQRFKAKSVSYPSPGPSSASDVRSSPCATSPRQPARPEKQQAQLPYETETCIQSCEKDYGNQNHTNQDDMQWIDGVLHGDDFSFNLSSNTTYLKPIHLLSEPSSKDLSDCLEASKPSVTLTSVGEEIGTDEGIEGNSGQAWAGDHVHIAATDGGDANRNYRQVGRGGSGGEGDGGEDDNEGDGDVAMIGGLEEDFSGYNALHLAAYLGQVGTVRLLLQLRPADANRAVEGGQRHAPLHIAAAHHHLDVVRVLLDHGAEALLQDGLGCTPLHVAVRSGAHAVTHLLVRWCVELLHIRDAMGRTPLHDAIIKGHEETVRLLLGHGADVTAIVM